MTLAVEDEYASDEFESDEEQAGLVHPMKRLLNPAKDEEPEPDLEKPSVLALIKKPMLKPTPTPAMVKKTRKEQDFSPDLIKMHARRYQDTPSVHPHQLQHQLETSKRGAEAASARLKEYSKQQKQRADNQKAHDHDIRTLKRQQTAQLFKESGFIPCTPEQRYQQTLKSMAREKQYIERQDRWYHVPSRPPPRYNMEYAQQLVRKHKKQAWLEQNKKTQRQQKVYQDTASLKGHHPRGWKPGPYHNPIQVMQSKTCALRLFG